MEECISVYICGEGLREGTWVNQGEAKRLEEMNQKPYSVEGGEGGYLYGKVWGEVERWCVVGGWRKRSRGDIG